MSTKAELQALLDRVKAAKGPDRELDYAIARAAGLTVAIEQSSGSGISQVVRGKGRRVRGDFTASLDTITTLIERKFLYTWWGIVRDGMDEFGRSCLPSKDLPRYLTAAFLSAMIAQMEAENAE